MPDSCDRCHRHLSDPESRRLGRGPVCRSREPVTGESRVHPLFRGILGAFQSSRRDPPARSWSFVLEEPGFVVLADLGTGKTITNDAENVLAELGRLCSLEGRRVIYRDTDGTWDEILHEGVTFRGFAPIGTRGTYRDAIEAARATCPVVVRCVVCGATSRDHDLHPGHAFRAKGTP